MARRGSKIGYQGYRGRGGGSLVLKVIVALLATTLAAGVIFVVFLGDYMEYTDNGVRFHPPWSTPEDKSSPLPSQALVVVPNPLVTDSLNTPQPTPVSPIGAVEVTPQQLRDGSAKDAVALAEGTALVVEMKAATGALAWQSQNELALTLGVNSQDNAVAQAVQALAQEDELYLIARIQGFRDRSLAEHNLGTLMTRGGNIWYDAQGVCWSNPTNQEAADYLTALCLELADMGFDEIVLEGGCYPYLGEVEVLARDGNRPEDLTAPVAAFYSNLTQTLSGLDVTISIQTTQETIAGNDTHSGLTPQLLVQYAHRIWLPQEAEYNRCATLLRDAGMENAAQRLVIQNSTQGSWYR